MRTTVRIWIFVGAAVLASGVDVTLVGAPALTLVRDAAAIVGAPLTPVSYAGVARRTTRRAVVATSSTTAAASASAASAASASAAESAAAASAAAASAQASAAKPSAVPVGTVVQALPAGCVSVTVNGKSYNDCGGSFYAAAFQGNNLVYVVVEKPIQ